MGSETTEPTGPDLRAGVPLSDVPDGGGIAGHVDGEAVLLARRGDELFAIGATCTHYGGPLGAGLIADETVRCPWHQACFSLRTGEAVRAPALNPVARYRVELRDGRAYVTEKLERAPRPRGAGEGVASIVIVGAGASGDAAAERLRREGFEGRITLVGRDDAAPYDRPNLSKDYLAGTAPEEWLPLRSASFYEEQGIDLILGTTVSDLDADGRRVRLADGRTFAWDRLLLATGAEPIRLPIPGADLPHVHYLRTLADCRAILAHDEARRAVVVGAGFIGMEVAASLRKRGIEVHLVAPERLPMERVFGPEPGEALRALHEKEGVALHLERTVARIGERDVTLSDGAELAADLVVIGAGVRPETDLAERAGLDVDDGVLVDEYLETSRRGIFAAGDAARWPDPRSGRRARVEHWVVAQQQGQVAALNMLGQRRPYDHAPFFWTHQFDLGLRYVGHAPEWDHVDVSGSIEDRDATLAYRLGGRTLAVVTVGRDGEALRAAAAFERGGEEALAKLGR